MAKRTEEEKKEIRKKWKELINMGLAELKSWDENKDKLKASMNREEASKVGIRSGLQSLKNIIKKKDKPFDKWTDKDYDDASAEINFNSRMLGSKPGKEVPGTGKSKWEISLKNWGHNSSKGTSPGNKKMENWKNKKKASSELLNYRKYLVDLLRRRKPDPKNKEAVRLLGLAITLADMKMKKDQEPESNVIDQKEEDSIIAEMSDMIENINLSHEERSAVNNMMDISSRTIKTGAKVDVLNLAGLKSKSIFDEIERKYKTLDSLPPDLPYVLKSWKSLLADAEGCLNTDALKRADKSTEEPPKPNPKPMNFGKIPRSEMHKREDERILEIRNWAKKMVNELVKEKATRQLTAFYTGILLKQAAVSHGVYMEVKNILNNGLTRGSFYVPRIIGKTDNKDGVIYFNIKVSDRQNRIVAFYRVSLDQGDLRTIDPEGSSSFLRLEVSEKDLEDNEERGEVIFEASFKSKMVDLNRMVKDDIVGKILSDAHKRCELK